jgi:diguanylate cyclase (GGDEF)-like protein
VTNPSSNHPGQGLYIPLLCLITALAILSEWGKFQFIYGIIFTFTSLFTLLSLRMFGLGRGIIVAAIAYGIGSIWLGQPFINLLGILEVVIVGLLLRRYPGRLFAMDAVYWFILGIPLTYAFYAHEYAGGFDNIRLFVGIVVINGLFNALFAEIIHQYSPKHRLLGFLDSGRKPSTFSQILLHFAFGIVMISFLLNMMVNTVSSFKEVGMNVQVRAKQTIYALTKEWEHASSDIPWIEQRTEQLQAAMDRYSSSFFTISLVDSKGTVIASNVHSLLGKSRIPESNRTYVRISDKLKFSEHTPRIHSLVATTWGDEHFLYEEGLLDGSGRFLIEVQLSSYQNYLYDKYEAHLLFLAIAGLAAALFSLFIQRSISGSLQRLAGATTNLPLKLKEHHEPEWPRSNILEIHSLISNFKHMASNLRHLFTETQMSNERLQAQAELLQQSEERLHQLAYYDVLTGLPNRLHFTKHLQELIDLEHATGSGLRIGVFFADINRFKQINDTLGHSAGDELLKLVAHRFMNYPGKKCDVFRLGGDEFVFIYAYKHEAELELGARAICSSFDEPFVIEGKPLFVKISVGISKYPEDGADMDTVIRNADIAMYHAKEEGNGYYRFFKPSLAPLVEEKMQIDNGLYKALKEEQFSLHYQPKINAATGELCGIEALIRWSHPELGMVPPDKFIPLAEESGFILEIDNWVFREACRQNKEWQDAGLKKISVSVNISARHFFQGNLKEMVERGLADTGLDPHYVSLEITEGVFMRNMEQVIETILYLRGRGIQISIDDFGTGYSSLNQLQRLPISDVKLDRSFIRGITSDEKKSSIVKAIIDLVHSMNMKVVAEGVETADESQFCKDLRCDELQGYLFSRPLPAEQLKELLK